MKKKYSVTILFFSLFLLTACVTQGRKQQIEKSVQAQFKELGLGKANVYVKAGLTDESGTSYATVTLSNEQKKDPLFDYGEADSSNHISIDFNTSFHSEQEDDDKLRQSIVSKIYDVYGIFQSINWQANQEGKQFLGSAGNRYNIETDVGKLDKQFTNSVRRIHELGTRTTTFQYEFESTELDEAITILKNLIDKGYFAVTVSD